MTETITISRGKQEVGEFKLDSSALFDISTELDDSNAYLNQVNVLLCHIKEFVQYESYDPCSKQEEERARAYELCRNAPVIYSTLSACQMFLDDVRKIITTQSAQIFDSFKKTQDEEKSEILQQRKKVNVQ
jgi:hypothetical protein